MQKEFLPILHSNSSVQLGIEKREFRKVLGRLFGYATNFGIVKFGRLPDVLEYGTFLKYCHEGQTIAQSKVLKLILEIESERKKLECLLKKEKNRSKTKQIRSRINFLDFKELALRKLMDTIIWTVLDGQIHNLRRFFIGEVKPVLSSSNYQSLLKFQVQYLEENPGSLVLFNDLSTFLQVGDVICVSFKGNRSKIEFFEIKEGRVNEEIFSTLDEFFEKKDPEIIERFFSKYGKKGIDQVNRIFKQSRRSRMVQEYLATGKGTDIQTGLPAITIDANFNPISYFPLLAEMIATAKTNSWAYDCLDSSLFIGVYDGSSPMQSVFDFLMLQEKIEFPTYDIRQFILSPLTTPIYMFDLPRDTILDIIFGNIVIKFCIDFKRLVEKSNELLGLNLYWMSKKEAVRIAGKAEGTFIEWNKKVLGQKKDGAEFCLGLGLIPRILCDFILPSQVMKMLTYASPKEDLSGTKNATP